MSEAFDAYHSWLGIPPEEQPPNHYRLLGITLFESKPDVIEHAADQRMAHLKSFQAGKHSALSQQLLNQVAQAKICLLVPQKRAAYDAMLRQQMTAWEAPSRNVQTAYPAQSEPAEYGQSSWPVPSTIDTPPLHPRSTAKRRNAPPIAAMVAGVAALLAVGLVVWIATSQKKPVAQPDQTAKAKKKSAAPSPVEKKKEVDRPPDLLPPSPNDGKKADQPPKTPEGENKTTKPPPDQMPQEDTVTIALTNSIGMQFVLIPAGEFMMGSSPEEIALATRAATNRKDKGRVPSEAPRHRVRISRAFYLGVYEITQAEYERVMGSNPGSFSAKGKEAGKVAGKETSRHPVETVSWNDAVQFCEKLSAMPKERAAHRMYRLPREAEWEYAARAGSTTKWSFGDDPALLGDHAWYRSNSGGMTHPVGQKKPNAWGLYDMHGNVGEWCMDWHAADFYRQSGPIDPVGPQEGSNRVDRGCGWVHTAGYCRSAHRFGHAPENRSSTLGFRVALVPAD